MTKLSNVVDKFGVYTYKSDLLNFRVEDFRNWKHRELTVKKDFLAKTYITNLDEEIFAEKPIFTPNIFPKREASDLLELDQNGGEGYDVSQEWELEKWDDLNKKYFDAARTHRFCVVQLYNKPPWWRVFTWREITKIEYDKNDNPIGCHVQWEKKLVGSDEYRFHEENLSFYRDERLNNDGTALFVPFGNPSGDELGVCDLEAIWDLIIYIRYMLLNIANNSAKTSGFYHWMYGDGIAPDQKQDLLDSADIVGSGSGVGATESVLKKIDPIFVQNPEFTVLALNEALLLFAGSCRLPLSFFRSQREGGSFIGGGGSGEWMDEIKVTKKKKYIFSQFAGVIKKLVEMRWGIIVEDVVPYIQAEIDTIELDIKEEEQNDKNIKEDDKNA